MFSNHLTSVPFTVPLAGVSTRGREAILGLGAEALAHPGRERAEQRALGGMLATLRYSDVLPPALPWSAALSGPLLQSCLDTPYRAIARSIANGERWKFFRRSEEAVDSDGLGFAADDCVALSRVRGAEGLSLYRRSFTALARGPRESFATELKATSAFSTTEPHSFR